MHTSRARVRPHGRSVCGIPATGFQLCKCTPCCNAPDTRHFIDVCTVWKLALAQTLGVDLEKFIPPFHIVLELFRTLSLELSASLHAVLQYVGAHAAQTLICWSCGKLCLGVVLQVVLAAVDVHRVVREPDLEEGLRLHIGPMAGYKYVLGW